jgi:hypothetical protein
MNLSPKLFFCFLSCICLENAFGSGKQRSLSDLTDNRSMVLQTFSYRVDEAMQNEKSETKIENFFRIKRLSLIARAIRHFFGFVETMTEKEKYTACQLPIFQWFWGNFMDAESIGEVEYSFNSLFELTDPRMILKKPIYNYGEFELSFPDSEKSTNGFLTWVNLERISGTRFPFFVEAFAENFRYLGRPYQAFDALFFAPEGKGLFDCFLKEGGVDKSKIDPRTLKWIPLSDYEKIYEMKQS